MSVSMIREYIDDFEANILDDLENLQMTLTITIW